MAHVSLNGGDAENDDSGLAGAFDDVRIDTDADAVQFDFEPAVLASVGDR